MTIAGNPELETGNESTIDVVVSSTDIYPIVQLESWQVVGIVAIASVFSVLTICGNLLVLTSYYVDRTIRQPNNFFIASLAVSDLIIGIEGFPIFTIYVVYGQSWVLGREFCKIWLFLDYSVCLVSILTVLFITIDRYCAVCHAVTYRKLITSKVVTRMIAFSWLGPAILFATLIWGWRYFTGKEIARFKCYAPFLLNPYVNMSLYLVYYWMVLGAIVLLYHGIHKVAHALEARGIARERQFIALMSTQIQMAQISYGLISGRGRASVPNAGMKNPKPRFDKKSLDLQQLHCYNRNYGACQNKPRQLSMLSETSLPGPPAPREHLQLSKPGFSLDGTMSKYDLQFIDQTPDVDSNTNYPSPIVRALKSIGSKKCKFKTRPSLLRKSLENKKQSGNYLKTGDEIHRQDFVAHARSESNLTRGEQAFSQISEQMIQPHCIRKKSTSDCHITLNNDANNRATDANDQTDTPPDKIAQSNTKYENRAAEIVDGTNRIDKCKNSTSDRQIALNIDANKSAIDGNDLTDTASDNVPQSNTRYDNPATEVVDGTNGIDKCNNSSSDCRIALNSEGDDVALGNEQQIIAPDSVPQSNIKSDASVAELVDGTSDISCRPPLPQPLLIQPITQRKRPKTLLKMGLQDSIDIAIGQNRTAEEAYGNTKLPSIPVPNYDQPKRSSEVHVKPYISSGSRESTENKIQSPTSQTSPVNGSKSEGVHVNENLLEPTPYSSSSLLPTNHSDERSTNLLKPPDQAVSTNNCIILDKELDVTPNSKRKRFPLSRHMGSLRKFVVQKQFYLKAEAFDRKGGKDKLEVQSVLGPECATKGSNQHSPGAAASSKRVSVLLTAPDDPSSSVQSARSSIVDYSIMSPTADRCCCFWPLACCLDFNTIYDANYRPSNRVSRLVSAAGQQRSGSSRLEPTTSTTASRSAHLSMSSSCNSLRSGCGHDALSERSSAGSWVKYLRNPSMLLSRERKSTHEERRAHRAFRIITLIVGAFALLWSPYYVMATVYGFCPTKCISDAVYNVAYYMCYLNSTINPVCYALANVNFRQTFYRLVVKRDFRRR